MAKQLVGPVERHVEKLVAGLAGIVLIGVIAKFLVTSPNFLELGGEKVPPAGIAGKVSAKAAQARESIRAHRPSQKLPEPLYPEFVSGLDPFKQKKIAPRLAIAVPFGPPIPVIDVGETIKGQKKLLEVVRLPKPRATYGRSTFNMGDGEASYVVDNWVTVSAVFDRKRQIAIQKQQYGAKHDEIVFGPVELQRRALRPDGTWSDDDWADVDAWPAATAPEVPSFELISKDGHADISHDSGKEIAEFYDNLTTEDLQLQLLRPMMPDVYNGTKWTFPILTSYRDVMKQDTEYLNPEAEEDDLEDRYGLGEHEEVVVDEEELTPQQQIAEWFKIGEELLKRAQDNESRETAIEAYNAFSQIVVSKDASAADKAKAKRRSGVAEQVIRDIDRKVKLGRPSRGEDSAESESRRELLPIQQVWVHDAGYDSVKSGTTYQYRMRISLFNQLVGEPAQFADKTDATVVLVKGEWSEPTDPIFIEKDRQFFVTGCDERKRTVRIELFKWIDGVWVTHRGKFGIGDLVTASSRKDVPIPDSDDIDRPKVTFDQGVEIVDIDFERSNRERRVKADGVTFPDSLGTTCAAVLVDSDGMLQERFVLTEKSNPNRRALAKRVFRAPRRR